ncbi:MAG: CrcB family protein [Peptostreptococcaceae bacterium]|nr:CrcB family protein [Peptostreptococcaceae bacterium]
MKKNIYIAAGGMLGAMSRFGFKDINIWDFHGIFPIHTLLVNMTGSFLLLMLLTISFEILEFDADIRLGIATGFLGAYTTFSTLCKESVSLLMTGEYITAVVYILASAVLGLAAAYLGLLSGRKMIGKLTRGNFDFEFEEKPYTGEVE